MGSGVGGGGEWVVVWVGVGVGGGVGGEGVYGCAGVWVCGCVGSRHRWPAVIASAVGAQSMRCANGRWPSSCGVRFGVGVGVVVRVRVRVRVRFRVMSHAIRRWWPMAVAPCVHRYE